MDQPISDEDLLARFAQGHHAALGELADRYECALLGLAGGLLDGSRDLACDAVQETWLRVIRFAARFDGQSTFKTWLYRITINQCHSLRTGVAARDLARPPPSEPERSEPERKRAACVAPSPRAEPDPHDSAESAESREALRSALETLLPEQRDVLLLCYHHGLTHPEAADILEIPLGTLKSRLHAALENLRTKLTA